MANRSSKSLLFSPYCYTQRLAHSNRRPSLRRILRKITQMNVIEGNSLVKVAIGFHVDRPQEVSTVLLYCAADLIALARDAFKEGGCSSSYADREQRGVEASMYVPGRWR